MGKIEKNMQDLAPNNMTDTLDDYLKWVFETTESLTNFELITNQDILLIISAAPPKSCKLDPMPTTLLKAFRDVIAPYIKDIDNTSIVSVILRLRLTFGQMAGWLANCSWLAGWPPDKMSLVYWCKKWTLPRSDVG